MMRAAPWLLSLASAGVIAWGFADSSPALLATWRLVVILAVGLSLGSLMLVAIGRLLANKWRKALEDELLPAAGMLPVTLLLALPLGQAGIAPATDFFGDALTPLQQGWFAADARLLRLGGVAIVWLGALLLVRRGRSQAANACGLALAACATMVAVVDWMLLTQPFWWSKLFPFAVVLSQLSAALAFAFLVNGVLHARTDDAAFRSLSAALNGLALLAGWIWFAQYLTAWAVNLPEEANWYVRRSVGIGTPILSAAAGLIALAVASLTLLHRRPGVLALASGCMLAAHGLHTLWWFRPTVDAAIDLRAAAGVVPLVAVLGGWFAWAAIRADTDEDRREASD